MPAGTMGPGGPRDQATTAAIRAHMTRQKISGNVLAAKIGVSQNYLATRLRDEKSFKLSDIETICAALNIQIMDLVYESTLLMDASGPDLVQRDNRSNSTASGVRDQESDDAQQEEQSGTLG